MAREEVLTTTPRVTTRPGDPVERRGLGLPRSPFPACALVAGLLALVGCARGVSPPSQLRARASVGDSRGFRMVTFRLEQEGARASLLLPGDVRAGDTVTGLLDVGTEKAPLDEAVRSRIDALVVEAAGSRATIGSGHLTLTVPEGAEEVEVTLLDPSGTALAAIGAAVAPAVAADPGEPSCELPAYGQSGGLLALGGRFDGDAATTWVRVGGELLPVWAESPRRVIVRAPGGTGPFEIEVRDGGWSCRTEGHLVAVRWNPRSTAAARGETVRVAVRVGGLSGLASSDLASSPRPVVDLWTWTLAHPHTRVHHSVEVASLERDVWVTELPVVAGHYGVFKTLARLSQP